MTIESQQQLAALLIEPRETLGVEFKSWLNLSTDNEHKAVLAKAVIAMANHGGGVVIFGYRATPPDDILEPDPSRPENLSDYTTDCVNAITSSYLEPPIHCEVRLVSHPTSGVIYPMVIVPPGKNPVRSKRAGPSGRVMDQGQYFIRRPGPKSELPQTGQEWDALISRCVISQRENLLEQIRAILLGASDPQPVAAEAKSELDAWTTAGFQRWKSLVAGAGTPAAAKFQHGHFCVSYVLSGQLMVPTLAPFREMLERNKVNHTGWPLFITLARTGASPYPFEGLIEAWIGKDSRLGRPANADFWRAAPSGKFFLIRGHAEDGLENGAPPGELFDITIPAWRVGEALLHASAMASALGDPGAKIGLRVEWTGLSGRRLVHLEGRRMIFDNHTTQQDTYSGYAEVAANTVADTLPEVVDRVVRPLYEIFNFFQIPASLTAEEIARMRANSF